MDEQKSINTCPCDILRLKQEGFSPGRIAEELGCSTEAVRAFLRTEAKHNPVEKATLPNRLHEYLFQQSPRKIYYQELINVLETYPQSLNYAIRTLLEKGLISCTLQPKYKTRLYWLTKS